MVATLQSRKEALEAKILEKNEELKKLCLQEADLTGVIPPEIPLEPGEPPPSIRRRVGTSFSFPQSLINNVNNADDESLNALELECKVQTNIAEAALALANDSSANKAARRKHRLMYRQSQRRLTELETRLNLLKQGKSQPVKPLHIKKKPRPNTTAVENLGFLWNKANDLNQNYFSHGHLGSWSSNKTRSDYSSDDVDGSKDVAQQNEVFGTLQRSFKSSGTSQSSISPRTDIDNDDYKIVHPLFNSNSYSNHVVPPSFSHYNNQEFKNNNLMLSPNSQHHKRNGKRGNVRQQWDTQSAGGTLLPSQTYPNQSHHPNLSRTQSLGSVESNPQKSKDSWSVQDFSYERNAGKEKEWYETSLDSVPSPPLRTTSRLPSTARMLYQMHESQGKDINWNNGNMGNLQSSNSHPALPTTPNLMHKNFVRSSSTYSAIDPSNVNIDNLSNCMQQMQLVPGIKNRNSNRYVDDPLMLKQKDYFYNYFNNDNPQGLEYSPTAAKPMNMGHPQEAKIKQDMSYPSTSNDPRFMENNPWLHLARQNISVLTKYKEGDIPETANKNADDYFQAANNNTYINIPEGNHDLPLNSWLTDKEFPNQIKTGQVAVPQEYASKTQTPTQPYYHVTKTSPGKKIKNLQYQAARNRHSSITEEQVNYQPPSPHNITTSTYHPPHAITQNEISFDTVVPFESPQNHTVVQAGKWQPYREVTKPFEMSDFYKYSTKFKQQQAQSNRATTPDTADNSPTPMHQKGVYKPLKPMTCKPIENRNNQLLIGTPADAHCDDIDNPLVEVSPSETV